MNRFFLGQRSRSDTYYTYSALGWGMRTHGCACAESVALVLTMEYPTCSWNGACEASVTLIRVNLIFYLGTMNISNDSVYYLMIAALLQPLMRLYAHSRTHSGSWLACIDHTYSYGSSFQVDVLSLPNSINTSAHMHEHAYECSQYNSY